MSRAAASLPASLAPRGLNRVQAAGYVGVSPNLFDQMVRDGRMPRPKRVNARKVWDRVALDEAFTILPTDGERSASEWDEVLDETARPAEMV